jgi:hypothetical protein
MRVREGKAGSSGSRSVKPVLSGEWSVTTPSHQPHVGIRRHCGRSMGRADLGISDLRSPRDYCACKTPPILWRRASDTLSPHQLFGLNRPPRGAADGAGALERSSESGPSLLNEGPSDLGPEFPAGFTTMGVQSRSACHAGATAVLLPQDEHRRCRTNSARVRHRKAVMPVRHRRLCRH